MSTRDPDGLENKLGGLKSRDTRNQIKNYGLQIVPVHTKKQKEEVNSLTI